MQSTYRSTELKDTLVVRKYIYCRKLFNESVISRNTMRYTDT